MSLQAIQSLGHAVPAPLAALPRLDWAKLLQLVRQDGPLVLAIAADLLAGTPAASLVSRYGQIVLQVVDVLIGTLPTPPPSPTPAP